MIFVFILHRWDCLSVLLFVMFYLLIFRIKSVVILLAVQRNRNFYTLLYPESCPDNFIDIIKEFHVEAFLSPLHDQDLDKYGEPKKAHYHFMVMYDSPHTLSQFQREICEPLHSVGADICRSRRGYARYLCHLDDPDKAPYNVDDVISFAGASYVHIINSASDNISAVKDILQFCNVNHVTSFSYLLDFSAMERPDWFEILLGHYGRVIKDYIYSKPYKPQWKKLPDMYDMFVQIEDFWMKHDLKCAEFEQQCFDFKEKGE